MRVIFSCLGVQQFEGHLLEQKHMTSVLLKGVKLSWAEVMSCQDVKPDSSVDKVEAVAGAEDDIIIMIWGCVFMQCLIPTVFFLTPSQNGLELRMKNLDWN